MYFGMSLLAIAAGLSFAVQGPVNSALGKRTHALWATFISFLGGTIILIPVLLLVGNGSLMDVTKAQPWQFLGGLYGAFNVCVTILAMPVLGVALPLTAVMLGQMLSGAIIDGFGLLGVEKANVTGFRVAGIIAVFFGILLIYLGSAKGASEEKKGEFAQKKGKRLVVLSLCFIGGVLGGMQSPTNAVLASVIGNWESTFMSFAIGVVSVGIVMLIVGKGKIKPMRGVGVKPWMLIGGLYGVIGIFLNLYTVSTLGAAFEVACCNVGQLSTGLIIDGFGLLGTEKVKVEKDRVIGVAVIMVGVVLVTIEKLI